VDQNHSQNWNIMIGVIEIIVSWWYWRYRAVYCTCRTKNIDLQESADPICCGLDPRNNDGEKREKSHLSQIHVETRKPNHIHPKKSSKSIGFSSVMHSMPRPISFHENNSEKILQIYWFFKCDAQYARPISFNENHALKFCKSEAEFLY
jgi:hypothetical protein